MNTSNNNKSKRTHSNEDSKRSPTKRQHRNENEKRRRDLFSQLISNLEEILNIDKASLTNNVSPQNIKLDKASILRETAEYLKKHQNNLIFQNTISSSSSSSKRGQNDEKDIDEINEIIDFSWKPPSEYLTLEEWIQIAIESLNCFFLVGKSDPHNGQIVYVSSHISSLLDYSQNELLNRSLFELILSRDHDSLRAYFFKHHQILEKCSLSMRRATADEYEHCTLFGAFRQINRKKESDENYLMSIVQVNTIDRTLVINNHHLNHQFTTRLNLHGKFIYIDPKAREYLGYSSYELIGHSYFDFVHPDDLPIIVRAHQIWKENGNGRSDSYRFLSKGQQWIFLQTDCQVQINSWTGKPENYLCTSFTIQNPTESIQKHITPLSSMITTISSHIPNLSMESRSQIDSMLRTTDDDNNASMMDTQITSFLSHLTDENYRITIREKLNQRKLNKQDEIRNREEEINVIEDIIHFIDQFQSKQTYHQISNNNNNENNSSQRIISNQLIRSPITFSMDDYSPHYSPILSRHSLSRDDILPDTILSSSSQQQQQQHVNEQISSPMTPFSNLSRPSPRTPSQFPISPSPSSPFIQLRSPSNTNQQLINQDLQQSIPSQPPSSTESSSSSSSASSTSVNTNSSLDQSSSKKSSFNRSLPHSLVS